MNTKQIEYMLSIVGKQIELDKCLENYVELLDSLKFSKVEELIVSSPQGDKRIPLINSKSARFIRSQLIDALTKAIPIIEKDLAQLGKISIMDVVVQLQDLEDEVEAEKEEEVL